MSGQLILRTVAVAASVALLLTAMATPVAAAKPKCFGQEATIVGTNGDDILKGTPGRDVIVAMGGNDIVAGRAGNDFICGGPGNDRLAGQSGWDRLAGQSGNDRLFGGPGVDRVFGGAHDDLVAGGAGPDVLGGDDGNDRIDGGVGVDLCSQGTGTGSKVRCELPVPEPPTLVIAYSDVDNDHAYDVGDVMISKIVDTDGNGDVSVGDTIKMGQYPTHPGVIKPAKLRSQFEDWKVKSHVVDTVVPDAANVVNVTTASGGKFIWVKATATDADLYLEELGSVLTVLIDDIEADENDESDLVHVDPGSPSQPTSDLESYGPGKGDDGFIDVEMYS